MNTTEISALGLSLAREMEQEAIATRKMLSRIPADKFDWKPHEKSMTITRLASHIAELPGWVEMTVHTDELDFAKGDYQPELYSNTTELLAFFERKLAGGIKALEHITDETLAKPWTLRKGDHMISVRPKSDVMRMALCQIVHHRAQLGVYLRLLDVPLPGSYGPTADEGFM